MRILDRLVAATFVRLFFLSILATPPLFILGDLTENLDRYLDRVSREPRWPWPISGCCLYTSSGRSR